MSATRVIAVFIIMGLLLGGAFGFANWRQAQQEAARSAEPGSPLDPLRAEAERAGLQDGRLVSNRMGVQTVCGRVDGRPAVYRGGRLYSAADEQPQDFTTTWQAWCAPDATEPVVP